MWVSFTSYVQPPSVYRYDYAADRLTPYHVPDVGLDASAYVTDQVWYESRDGTRVSMFIVHRKDLPRDGRRPVRLSGYGGFNISVQPRFTALNAAWLKLGGVLAFANVRGGGEYGRAWHEAAVKTRRQNAFDDYIAAARWLVSAGYTTPSKLASRGNSNGGLLVAVTAMQAPEAFGAVFCRAPHLDMLRFPNSATRAAATVEYGSPDDPVEGAYLAGYSPYHNVRADRRYPVMMFVPALNDRIAPPHDPLKMVARLQAEAHAGRALSPAAAPGLGTRRRHHADGAHRTRRRRAELLLLGARRRTARQAIPRSCRTSFEGFESCPVRSIACCEYHNPPRSLPTTRFDLRQRREPRGHGCCAIMRPRRSSSEPSRVF